MKLARRYPALLAVPGRLRNSAYGLRQSSPTSPRAGCAARRGRRGRGPCRGLGWWLRRRLKRAVEWWWRAHAALSSSPFHGQLPLRMTWKGAPILDLQGACPETKYRSGPPKACLQTPHQTWLFGQCLKLSTPLCPSPPPSNAGRDGKGRGLSEAAGRVPQPPSRASSAGDRQTGCLACRRGSGHGVLWLLSVAGQKVARRPGETQRFRLRQRSVRDVVLSAGDSARRMCWCRHCVSP